MTDDELRAAAERVAGNAADVLTTLRDVSLPASLRMATDCAAVCARLLELLPPADDGEPVTEEWLKAVGGERHKGWQPKSLTTLDYYEFVVNPSGSNELSVSVWANGDGWWLDTQDDEPDLDGPITRGHVRRLCSALGIPLTEGAAHV